MTDEPKHHDPFKPQDPTIPGVTGNPARVKPAPEPPAPLNPGHHASHARAAFAVPRLWLTVGLIVLAVVVVGFLWHSHSTAAKESNNSLEPTVSTSAPAPARAPAPDPEKSVRLGPGPVATAAELAKPWASKRFLFRAPQTADDVPALVVHLPGNVYWGISMREPFGTCEMQYVTNLEQIANQFHYAATHPMVVDPCNGAVYDLDKYGPGPNGVVRGAIVHGAGVRPPMAIQMAARGKQIVAIQIEQ